jgi:hypothetical protein
LCCGIGGTHLTTNKERSVMQLFNVFYRERFENHVETGNVLTIGRNKEEAEQKIIFHLELVHSRTTFETIKVKPSLHILSQGKKGNASAPGVVAKEKKVQAKEKIVPAKEKTIFEVGAYGIIKSSSKKLALLSFGHIIQDTARNNESNRSDLIDFTCEGREVIGGVDGFAGGEHSRNKQALYCGTRFYSGAHKGVNRD